MKKIIGLCLIATLIAFTTNAQGYAQPQKFTFSVGGGISNASSLGNSITGFGVDLVAKTDISETLEGFAQTGYTMFNDQGSTIKYFPLLIGINFKSGNLRPGVAMGYGSMSVPYSFGFESGEYSSRTSGSISLGGFAISPQLGINFEKVDLVASYTLNQISILPVNIFGLKLLYKIQ
jgi:hypothetical protein